MKMVNWTCLLAAALLPLAACGTTSDGEEGPVDITDYDYTTEQVLEDIVEEEGAVDYYATAEMAVDANLIIKPGVVIEFEETSGFSINGGSLQVEGTSEAGVVFRERTAGKGWLGVSIASPEAQSTARAATPHSLPCLGQASPSPRSPGPPAKRGRATRIFPGA